jgi:hypothetical protein
VEEAPANGLDLDFGDMDLNAQIGDVELGLDIGNETLRIGIPRSPGDNRPPVDQRIRLPQVNLPPEEEPVNER